MNRYPFILQGSDGKFTITILASNYEAARAKLRKKLQAEYQGHKVVGTETLLEGSVFSPS